jgi:DNA-binding MarR family transcriptional regulator
MESLSVLRISTLQGFATDSKNALSTGGGGSPFNKRCLGLERRCTKCLAVNPSDILTCGKCGTPLLQGFNLFKMLVEIRRSTIKEDDYMIMQSLLHMASAFLTEPANMGVEAPSSEGKTYPVVETAKLFPPENVWFLAGLSPTAIAHDYGELVDAESKQPLTPMLMRLQEELEELRRSRNGEVKARKRDIRAEMARLLKNSAYLVDLENKILLFLDRPNPETLQKLYPILSHDVYESSYRFTDKKFKGPLKTVHVILRGWPTAIFIRVYGEREAENWAQTISRFTTVSPKMDVRKYRAAIRLKSLIMGIPGHLLVERLGLGREEWAREAVKMVSKRLTAMKTKVRERSGRADSSMFWIPFYKKIGEEFPAEVGRRMRDSERFLTLMQAHAALNVYARPKLVYPDGTEYIVVVREDYEDVAKLYFSEEDRMIILTGLPRHVLEFFRKVVKPLWDGKKMGLTVRELVDAVVKQLGKTLSDSTIRNNYIRQLENAGFISFEENPEDRREKIVRVLKEDFEKITGYSVILGESLKFTLEELKEAWNELIQICDSNPGINNMFKTHEVPKLLDPFGRELTIEELFKTYYFTPGSESHIEQSEIPASFGEKGQEKCESPQNNKLPRNLEKAGSEGGENVKFNIKKKYRVLRVLDTTNFAGVCELCGKIGANIVAEAEGVGKIFAHRRCLEGE